VLSNLTLVFKPLLLFPVSWARLVDREAKHAAAILSQASNFGRTYPLFRLIIIDIGIDLSIRYRFRLFSKIIETYSSMAYIT